MDRVLRQAGYAGRFLGVALLGCGLSLALYQASELDTRWFTVICVAIAAVAVSMWLVRIFSDFLLVVCLFSLPLASFSKWFWPSGFTVEDSGKFVYAGLFGVGLLDFILIGLYMSWFYRVFITREQPAPRFNRLDFLILWFVVAHLLATIGSQNVQLGLGSTEFLVKHVLFYFYLSRNLDERHLPWLLAAFAFIIFLEASLGSYQFTTGRLLGLAIDKGAGSSVVNTEVTVPGTEGYHRATGTSYDAHTLGHLMALIVPFPLVLWFTPRLRPTLKLACVAASAGALLVVLLSMSRSAWLASAIALMFGVVLILVVWQERQAVPALAAVAVLAAVVAPLAASFVYERFALSPIGTLTVRFEQYAVAWRVFTLYPLFGVGPGNWVTVFPLYDFQWLVGDPSYNLVHDVILWTAVEVGVFGLIPYLGILTTAGLRFFALARQRRDVAARLALAALIGMITTTLNGLTDPAYREPNVYLMFWLLVALSVALPRLRPGAGEILMAPLRPASDPAPIPAITAAGSAGRDNKQGVAEYADRATGR